MIRVLVVDDHAVVREGLKRVVDEAPGIEVGGEAANGAAALEKVGAERWDVVVLDLNLPGRSGLELLRDIKRSHPRLPVVILSMNTEDQYAVRVLKAGADGYLTKESAPDQLVEAIKKVSCGGKYVSGSLAEQLAVAVRADTDKEPHAALSDRELEVLCLLGSGLTVSQIADKLSLSVKTISTYRARILEKMGLENNSQLIHYAIRNHLVG